jgi:hypothetical protein
MSPSGIIACPTPCPAQVSEFTCKFMKKKFPTIYQKDAKGFTDWQFPVMRGYQFMCCDCGLIHDVQFDVVKIKKFLSKEEFGYDVVKGKENRVRMRLRRVGKK